MFLRNCWYVAGWSDDIAAGSLVSRTMLGEPIVLYRKNNGGVTALEDRCCHRLAPLSRGRIEGDDLRCMYHGLKFAPSGKWFEVPGQDLIPSTAVVHSYPGRREGLLGWLWMGDPTLIPAALGHDHPDWFMQTGQLAYEANYELINDNLLDLSHLSYVHEKTLGRSSMSWGESRSKITPIESGLRIARWVVNNPAAAYLDLPAEARTDMWASYDYGPARHIYWLEYPARGIQRGRRLRPGRQLHALCCNQGAARSDRRSPAFAGRALWHTR